eukprot:scaffold666656_cov47-Prasinocladus_malaysianus.AAC.1
MHQHLGWSIRPQSLWPRLPRQSGWPCGEHPVASNVSGHVRAKRSQRIDNTLLNACSECKTHRCHGMCTVKTNFYETTR